MLNRKRIFCIFITLVMLVPLGPWSSFKASAAYSGVFQFDENGKFTVMQIADTQDNQNPYERVIAAITDSIARYHPDLVVFTGDNVIETIVTNSNFETAINKILAPLNATGTKFAVTFGNHDDEGVGAPNKTNQYSYFKSVGGSNFVDHDVNSLDGVGSGVIPIYPYGQSSGTPAYQVYLMDSGSDQSSGSYDCPYTNQLDYYIQRSLTFPTVPSLWFQHVIVPDIYSECMTTANTGGGVSFKGSGSPFSDNTWYINPSKINWARCSSTSLADVYNEAPACANLSLYQSAAHRSSPSYGSKTLYEAWNTYGNLKGAYFGHDHLNEFTCTTDDGIDLGYGECTNLYKTLGVYAYNDDNPGVSIYQLSADGSYTNQYVAESDLAIPAVDPSAPTGGTFRVHAVTLPNAFGRTDCGTYDDVCIYFFNYQNPANNAVDYLYKSQTINGVAHGGNDEWTTLLNVPGPIKDWKSFQIRKTGGTDDWCCDYWNLYYTPLGGSEVLLGGYNGSGNDWFKNNPSSEQVNTPWFSDSSRTVTFNGNGADGGTTASQDIVYGTADFLKSNGFTKTGYTFAGWSTTSTGEVSYANKAKFQMGTANSTLYAKWTANVYNVGYNGNGSDGGSTSSSVHTYNTAKTLTVNGYIKTGYTFAGWATKEDGGITFTDGQIVSNIAKSGSVLLYAVWTPNVYTVEYYSNESDGGSTANSLHTYNAAQALTCNGFTKTGYSFSGWAASVGGPVVYQNGQEIINLATGGTLILYAVWSKDPVFLAKGGEAETVFDPAGNFIYGLEQGLTKDEFESDFVNISGFARLVYTYANGSFGTGTKVELVDNITNEVVQTYYIVIFGDFNGDGSIDSNDEGLIKDTANYMYPALDTEKDAAFFKAGDVYRDGVIDENDACVILNSSNYLHQINQITGTAP